MAYRYFGINMGKGEQDVTSGTSMLTTDIVVAYEETTVNAGEELEIHLGVEKILNAIQRGNFPV